MRTSWRGKPQVIVCRWMDACQLAARRPVYVAFAARKPYMVVYTEKWIGVHATIRTFEQANVTATHGRSSGRAGPHEHSA